MDTVLNDDMKSRRAGVRRVAWIGFAVALALYVGFILRVVLTS
ncbi:MAG: hypothetical protein WCD66_07190 [Rhodanobacteraceae bacterium]